MKTQSLLVKYYDRRTLLTLDLNAMFEVIMRSVSSEDLVICLEPMNGAEKAASTIEGPYFSSVSARIRIYRVVSGELMEDASLVEAAVVAGRK